MFILQIYLGGKYMNKEMLKGKIQTVIGLINPEDLGFTLMHEHILTDLSVFFSMPKEVTLREIATQPLSLSNLHIVRYKPMSNLDNCRFTNEELMKKEVNYFKEVGGCSIVEMSNTGLYGDPAGLARISRETGINIIKGGGFYIGKSQSPEVLAMNEDELTEQIISEIMIGFGETSVKAGLIGEIGCNAPIEDFEKKSLRASALAQKETGALINIHSSHKDDLVLENIRILKEAGADLSHVVCSHCDVWAFSENIIFKLLEQGCIIEFDTFGYEGIFPHYWGHHINQPTDEDRIKKIIKIINKGFIKQIVVGSDHCFKYLLRSYGGGGYSHLIVNDIPLMKINGMSESEINEITIENPKRLLQFI